MMPGVIRNNSVWVQTFQNSAYALQLKGESFGEQRMNCVAHVGFHHWHVDGLILRWVEALGNALCSTDAGRYLLQREHTATSCPDVRRLCLMQRLSGGTPSPRRLRRPQGSDEQDGAVQGTTKWWRIKVNGMQQPPTFIQAKQIRLLLVRVVKSTLR